MLMDPHHSSQHADTQQGVSQPQQDVTRPKAWFKPTLAEKSVVNWRTNQLPQLHSSSYLVER